MKQINQFITEYIIKKKLDKPIDSEDHYKYCPKTKDDLINIIHTLLDKGETNLNCIDTSEIKDMSHLFDSYFNKSKDIKFNFDISKWNVSNVESMKGMFFEYVSFNCDLSNWDVSNVKDMAFMFDGCKKFEGIGLEKWDVSNVKYMQYMFNNCENFKCKGLENWNVSNVENMISMFENCINFDCDLSNWNVSNVENMNYMFDFCTSLKNKPSWYKE